MFEFVKGCRTSFQFYTLSTHFSTSLSTALPSFFLEERGGFTSNLCEIFSRTVAFSAIWRYNVSSKRIVLLRRGAADGIQEEFADEE
ncbi:hypothetical protein [Flintibacter sp.]|uniref:hypothetical protein n=1 Tax=Flintibacter sp. TaxID=1918624 RepID=UPI00267113D2|nr:hypothetical protein [Flintibacter sp.]